MADANTTSPFTEGGLGIDAKSYTYKDISLFNGLDLSSFIKDNDITIRTIAERISNKDASIKVNESTFGLSGNDFSNKKASLNLSLNTDNATYTSMVNTINAASAGLGDAAASYVKDKVTGGMNWTTDKLMENAPNIDDTALNTDIYRIPPLNLSKYEAPITETLKSWKSIGDTIDNKLKDNFLLQTLNIKGTDLICSCLCLVMSMLPCKVTNEIYDTIDLIRRTNSTVNSALQNAATIENNFNTQVDTSFSGGITGLADFDSLKQTANSVVGIGNSTQNQSIDQKIQSIAQVISKVSVLVKTVNMLIKLVRVAYSAWSVSLAGGTVSIWNLVDIVLHALQAMAVAIADRVMNQLIAPIENILKNKYPSMCGLSAQLIYQKLLKIIYDFKSKLLGFIHDLFQFEKTKNNKFDAFLKGSFSGKDVKGLGDWFDVGFNATWALELSGLIKVLTIFVDNFIDLALGCGLQRVPCNDSSTNTNTINGQNNIQTPSPMSELISQIGSMGVAPFSDFKPDTEVSAIAKKLEPIINSIYPGNTKILSENGAILPVQEYTNLPDKILSFLPALNLGKNYTVYIDPQNSNAKIVYRLSGICS